MAGSSTLMELSVLQHFANVKELTLILQSMNLEALFMHLQEKWLSLVWIAVLFFLGKVLLQLVISKMVTIATRSGDARSEMAHRQASTLGTVLLTTGNVVIYGVILLMVLNFFGVNITPILASAGVVGVAIGFGAQTLVKDLLSGIFLLLEGRYTLGDQVILEGFEGEVVKITMRSTVLKNKDGQVFYISNGSIGKVTNLSQQDVY